MSRTISTESSCVTRHQAERRGGTWVAVETGDPSNWRAVVHLATTPHLSAYSGTLICAGFKATTQIEDGCLCL